MRRTWIIADDLTGAADAGAHFAGRNEQVILDLDPGAQGHPPASVQVIDTDTREATPAVSAGRMTAFGGQIGPDDLVLKKIDSLLRGNITPELGILRNRMPNRLLLVAPAVPALGRTTTNGYVRARNAEAVCTDQHIAPHIPAPNLHHVSPGDVPRAIRIANAEDALICDAETDEDLDAVVRAAMEAGLPVLWAGAAGLAAALARRLNPPPNQHRTTKPPTATKFLTVVGSHSQMALDQARALAAAGHLAIELTAGRHEELPRGTRVVSLTGAIDPRRREQTARTLGEICREAVRAADVLVLSGGATARAVLTAAGITALELLGDIEPGIVLSRPRGAAGPAHVITKSGSFGDEQSLVRLVAAIMKGQP
jgi:uncharacterized protein YgbK (DUF1537 family)